jgi:hypothetical protein
MKIGFCFLTYDKIIRYDIWNRFFENIDKNLYNVFIHPKYIETNNNLYSFKYNILNNRVKTERKDDINIVNATLKLLEEAYKNDIEITHFIFLSQSCIPLYNFEILYKIIIKFPLSIISYIDNNKKDRYYQLSNYIKPNIPFLKFVKQQPNMILIRNDVKILIENNHLTEHFKNMQCPDEHYFVNVLPNIFKRLFIKRQTHFCNPNLNRTQALEYYNIDKIFIDKIRNNGFLFMRKLTMKTNIDLDYINN